MSTMLLITGAAVVVGGFAGAKGCFATAGSEVGFTAAGAGDFLRAWGDGCLGNEALEGGGAGAGAGFTAGC